MNDKQLSFLETLVEDVSIVIPQNTRGEAIFNGRDLGTFKDSLRVPIHRWFRYPAGYSYKFVEAVFDTFDIKPGNWVYDPFSGSGTTLICAKQRGIHAYGVEAHEFVHWVADVKLRWEYDLVYLSKEIEKTIFESKQYVFSHIDNVDLEGVFPSLVYKCYHPQDLKVLYLLREYIIHKVKPEFVDLAKLALTNTLRGAAAAGTGWPYIAPNKNTGDKPPKKAFTVFENTLRQMVLDVKVVSKELKPCQIQNKLGDSRKKQELADGQVDVAITSPPYLNNYDYADRTRLETYFWGIVATWGEITEKFRNKLIVAATTQIKRNEFPDITSVLSWEISRVAPQIYSELQDAVNMLSKIRLTKGGKKDYDLMVPLYFNDIFRVVGESYRILRPGGRFCLVLGDSAPYGVHIQTDRIIGELGLGIGFNKYSTYELRTRGDKWKGNPQRHKIALRESVVVLEK